MDGRGLAYPPHLSQVPLPNHRLPSHKVVREESTVILLGWIVIDQVRLLSYLIRSIMRSYCPDLVCTFFRHLFQTRSRILVCPRIARELSHPLLRGSHQLQTHSGLHHEVLCCSIPS